MGTLHETIAEALGLTLVEVEGLTGGVSARTERLTLSDADGVHQEVVVRQHGAGQAKPEDPGVTEREYAVLAWLAARGEPVPRPLHLDVSGRHAPHPFIVLTHLPGATEVEPGDQASALKQMASFLAHLHGLDVSRAPPLPRRLDPLDLLGEDLPDTPALALAREVLAGHPRLGARTEVLLHGDFWPGNVLWRDGALVGVIDWEDAALGDAWCDLAGARLELLWRYGPTAMDAFTAHYLEAAALVLDPVRLGRWELYVGATGLSFMHLWGLEAEVESRWRARGADFLEAARLRVSSR